MARKYCLDCNIESMPGEGFPNPCTCSSTGSHRVVEEGEKRYRVRGPDGYVYLFSSVPDGYELVEEITY